MRSLIKYTRLSFVFLGFVLITLNCSAKKLDRQQSIVDGGAFSIALPTGWTNNSREVNGYKAFYLMAPRANDFNPNLNVLSENIGSASMAEYLKVSEQKMQAGGMVK